MCTRSNHERSIAKVLGYEQNGFSSICHGAKLQDNSGNLKKKKFANDVGIVVSEDIIFVNKEREIWLKVNPVVLQEDRHLKRKWKDFEEQVTSPYDDKQIELSICSEKTKDG
jgi:hypothetical protein